MATPLVNKLERLGAGNKAIVAAKKLGGRS